MKLKEDTRAQLLNASRDVGLYKDQKFGKNRFARRRLSKIADSTKAYSQVDMNKLFKQDELRIELPIIGESGDYTVTIEMNGVIAELAKNIKNNKNKLEYKNVMQAIMSAFNKSDVKINCSCPDQKFTHLHWDIEKGVSTEDSSKDPGPGKGIRNPDDRKGRGCKHILLVLDNMTWLNNLASTVNNYILYAEANLQDAFLKLIFPKLYGIQAEEMVEKDLIDDEKFLKVSKGLIKAIGEYASKPKVKTEEKPKEENKE